MRDNEKLKLSEYYFPYGLFMFVLKILCKYNDAIKTRNHYFRIRQGSTTRDILIKVEPMKTSCLEEISIIDN